MASLEKRIISAILNKIRAHRQAPLIQENGAHAQRPATLPPAKLREAQFSDYAAVTELKGRWGLTTDSMENWERLWVRNPALARLPVRRPIGWVLETDSGIVGYLGNISSTYSYGDKSLNAVTSSGLAVDPAYRAVSLSLVSAFYRQEAADLFLVTTAIPAVGRIARVFKSEPLPQADYETVLFWVLQPHPFAQAVARKLKLRPALAGPGSILGSVSVQVDTVLRGRRPGRPKGSLAVSEIKVEQIGDDFRALWMNKLKERPRLYADRSPCSLKWHYQIPGDTGKTTIFCCYDENELRGYAVVRNGISRMNGLDRSMVADMLVLQDDPEVTKTLLARAYDHAKKSGSHILEVLGFPKSVREVCEKGNPYSRKYPACPFYYKAADATLHKVFSDGAAWYATPFDGDTTLMP